MLDRDSWHRVVGQFADEAGEHAAHGLGLVDAAGVTVKLCRWSTHAVELAAGEPFESGVVDVNEAISGDRWVGVEVASGDRVGAGSDELQAPRSAVHGDVDQGVDRSMAAMRSPSSGHKPHLIVSHVGRDDPFLVAVGVLPDADRVDRAPPDVAAVDAVLYPAPLMTVAARSKPLTWRS